MTLWCGIFLYGMYNIGEKESRGGKLKIKNVRNSLDIIGGMWYNANRIYARFYFYLTRMWGLK